MKRTKKVVAMTLFALLCLSIFTATIVAAEPLNFTGTVKYITIEGGFWGIISDDGKNYDPRNLPAEFKQEGLRVQVEAVVKDGFSIHMWGTIIDVTAVSKADNTK